MPSLPFLNVDFSGSNSGPCAYKVSTLPASHSLPCLTSILVEFSEELCSIFVLESQGSESWLQRSLVEEDTELSPPSHKRPWDTGWSSPWRRMARGRKADGLAPAACPNEPVTQPSFSYLQVGRLRRRVLMRTLQSGSPSLPLCCRTELLLKASNSRS